MYRDFIKAGILFCTIGLMLCPTKNISAQDKPLKIFQFPANMIPRIDGDASDWDIVPQSYAVTTELLTDHTEQHSMPDKKTLDISVKVGWVAGINKLYFLYEAYDDCWIFEKHPRNSDIFEVVVDGDRSGGPFINSFHPDANRDKMLSYMDYHGCQAQNYHIFTPAPEGKDWTMVWGPQSWIKDLPWANAAYSYNFKHGESGKLTLEFWITPFDYAGAEGPQRAVESVLYENKDIGLSWAVIDYDKDSDDTMSHDAFWSITKNKKMYGTATDINTFRLMPLEEKFAPKIKADFSIHVVDPENRIVTFTDHSIGKINSWKWDFGDGTTSSEKSPTHKYNTANKYNVTLYIEGQDGKASRQMPWGVALK